MVAAICKEAEMRKDFLSGEKVETIYLGGGTPSVLGLDELEQLIRTINTHYPIQSEIEFTLEANPDDLTEEYLKGLVDLGVNRLSIGVQSFDSSKLSWMNRSHSLYQSYAAIEQARIVGIENISIDLIFGAQNSSMASWQHNLEEAIRLQVSHLSVYSLTVEEKTALAYQVKTGQSQLPQDEQFADQFLLAHELLTAAGYLHYELSNYSLSGWHSRHNSSYWAQQAYLGLGPSAHSFDGRKRLWNVANNAKYLDSLNGGKLPVADQEVLSLRDRYHEYLMTHLRKETGIHIGRIESEFWPAWENHFQQKINDLIGKGWMIREATTLRLTPEGWLTSDHVIGDFFMD